MPRSFSRSLESITRSATRWFSRNEPDCLQQLVDQRGLAMVDVGDDRDVAHFHGGSPKSKKPATDAAAGRIWRAHTGFFASAKERFGQTRICVRKGRAFASSPPRSASCRGRPCRAPPDLASRRRHRCARAAFPASCRVERIAGFLEGGEGVGVQHFRPHVGIIAGRIAVAREHMLEMRGAVAHDDLRRACRARPASAASNAIGSAAFARGMKGHVDQRRRGEFDRVEAGVEIAGGHHLVEQGLRHRLRRSRDGGHNSSSTPARSASARRAARAVRRNRAQPPVPETDG